MTTVTSRNDAKRIGIVEVGSRAIRLMVADFLWDGSFKALRTGSEMHQVEISNLSEHAAALLWSKVDRFYRELQSFSCDRAMVYGTALCRKLTGLGYPVPSYLQILSPEEEGVASWAAGFMCVKGQTEGIKYTAVDQGAGSTEIISAIWTGTTIAQPSFDTLDIGNSEVMELFNHAPLSYPRSIQERINRYDNSIKKHSAEVNSRLYLLGSVATKIAWIKVRKGVKDFYKPHLVNDVQLKVSDLYELYGRLLKIFNENPDKARSVVDARPEARDEFARVMSGSVFHMLLAKRMNYSTVRASGYGVRHGMAFLVRRELI